MRKMLKKQLRALAFANFSLKVKFLVFLIREHSSRDRVKSLHFRALRR